jgi:hypothetical protein
MTVYTTLKRMSAFDPSKGTLEKLLFKLNKTRLDNEPLPLVQILEINGLNEALWFTRTVFPEHRKKVVEFTIRCAESVLHNFEKQFPNEPAPKLAIQAAKDYLKCNRFVSYFFRFKLASAENSAEEVARFTTWVYGEANKAYDKALNLRFCNQKKCFSTFDDKKTWDTEKAAIAAARDAADGAKATMSAAWAAVYAVRVTRAPMTPAYSCAKEAAKAAGESFSQKLFREIFGKITI